MSRSPQDSPLVSVIIVNWNGAAYLRECLAALYQQTYAALEILIIDNGSTDHSLQIIETFQAQLVEGIAGKPTSISPELRIFRNARNEGFARGNNQGIRASHGEFILLLNQDVILDSRFIAHLVTLMQSDATFGIALGKLLNGHDPTHIDSTGILIRKNRRAFDRGQREADTAQYNRVEEVFGASGATCLYRRTMLEDIAYDDEYLDELFFMYKEDVDLSWRARLFGWKCVYTPEAVGWHYRTWATGKRKHIPRFLRRHSLKNRYLMMLKNDQWQTIRPYLGSILWFELCSFVYILLREPYLFGTVADIIRHWNQVMQKRRRIQQEVSRRQHLDNILPWFQ